METIILVLLIILISYVIGERAFRVRRLGLESIFIFAYGIEFILLGIIMGPYITGLLSVDVVDRLEPLINIALGWIGLMFGFQFRLRDLKLLPFPNYLVAGVESSVTFIIVTAIMMLALWAVNLPTIADTTIPLTLVFASIATVSSPAIIAALIKNAGAHGRVSRLMRYTAGFDNVIGIIAFGLAYPFFHLTEQKGAVILPGWGWLFVSISAGLAIGVLLHFFTKTRASSNENLMVAVGMVTLSTGIAAYLHLSTLFINLIVGIVLCNYSERQDRFYRLLISAEKPLYGILLIIAGALWRFSWTLLFVFGLFVLARVLAKTAGGWIALQRYRSIVRYPEWFGPAIIAQGGMSLAIALDYRFLTPGEASNLVVAVALTGLAINGLVCPFTSKHLLRLEGEIA